MSSLLDHILHQDKDLVHVCSPLNSQPLGWCLIHNRSSIHICWVNSFHWPYRLADLLEENQEELATIEALDSGAVYTLALKTHIGMSVQTFRYFAGWCDKIQVSTNVIWLHGDHSKRKRAKHLVVCKDNVLWAPLRFSSLILITVICGGSIAIIPCCRQGNRGLRTTDDLHTLTSLVSKPQS